MKTKEFKIQLDNGNSVDVYSSSLRHTVINVNDCETEYEKIPNSRKYKQIIKNK